MRLPTALCFFMPFTFIHAQGREKIVNTDSGRVVLHYFTTGQLSTKEWMDIDDRWGRSQAFARDGRELINHQTRKIGGHASVDFSYHSSGGISKAEVSDAPDGGIQWYRSTTTFDANGVQTGFTEQGQDNEGPITRPDVRVMPAPQVAQPIKQEEVKEQRMFSTEVFVVNASKYTCRMDVVAKYPSPALQNSNHTIAPGDTVRIGTYSTGEIYENATKHATITAKRWSRKAKKQVAYRILREEVTAVEPEARKYYVVIGR